METQFTTDSRTVIKNIGSVVARSEISLIALNHITSDRSLEYFKDLDKEDLPHNLYDLFMELGTIHSLLQEEISELRDFKLELQNEWTEQASITS